ncbi:haloacid dehalogenase [Dictyobacter alpinus]|uniref:Haloacid dehalogenase n=1 Tax=Dictyobacter alpinus TaxID=2014873 RepID=A0A402BD88_9CHLR|nr:HAD-IIIC family phosphatase [Dictyobacter alpinus]GCE29304.1 haloacid dehalogenase [Dictyobacter alpinus]
MTQQAVIKNEELTRSIKCVVWDLDNTLWDGTLIEDEQVYLRTRVVEIIKILDARGILHSIASKNDHQLAIKKLAELGIEKYFLYPQISWNAKSTAIATIAASINIGNDTLAFVDDQGFERDEVAHIHPEVLCLDITDLEHMLDMPELKPRFITDDSSKRRQMYLSDIQRNQAEKEYVGPTEEFLATLQMVFTITAAREEDLQRAEELTVRTHQLNTTGYTYSYEELNAFRLSPDYQLLIAGLEDTYGMYGKIGVALIHCGAEFWTLKLLLMSCRVMSRGVGNVLVGHIMRMAKQAGVPLRAEFIPNNKNRMMLITYKLGGFRQIDQQGEMLIFENDLTNIAPVPPYVTLQLEDCEKIMHQGDKSST